MSKAKRIELLTELHRPLEDHWAAAPRLGLDAKISDYTYKFHIASLQDIYSGQEMGVSSRIQTSGAKEIASESPATQLYGVRGLLTEMTPGRVRKFKEKESAWDNSVNSNPNILGNNNKKESINDNNHNQLNITNNIRDGSPSGRRSRPSSPLVVKKGTPNDSGEMKRVSSFSPSLLEKSQNKRGDNSATNAGSDSISSQRREVRCLYEGDKLKSYELKVLGMYKFNEAQKKLYEAFVDMISGFDEYDRGNIVEDALLDAEEQSSVGGFTGFGPLKAKKTEK